MRMFVLFAVLMTLLLAIGSGPATALTGQPQGGMTGPGHTGAGTWEAARPAGPPLLIADAQAATTTSSVKEPPGTMLVQATNPKPNVLPTLGVWQQTAGENTYTYLCATFPNIPDFTCDAWCYESGGIAFEGARALAGGVIEMCHSWKDHPYEIITTATPRPSAVEIVARLKPLDGAPAEPQQYPSLNLCWQLRRAPQFCSRPDPYPEFVKRCFIFTDEGRVFLDQTDRRKIPCRAADDPYNNPPWVQMYVGVWKPIPAVTPQTWADYSRTRYTVPIIGVVSRDGKYLAALANDSAGTMCQAWHDCEHNNPQWLPAKDGNGKVWRLMIYAMQNDPDKLLQRAAKDFPNLLEPAKHRVPAEGTQ